MRISFFTLLGAIVAGLLSAGSCSLGDDTVNATPSANCAITNMTLGGLWRDIYTTTSEGEDTIIKGTMSGSYFPLYIDQLRREIYNADYLPYGTYVNRVTVSDLTADGTVYYVSNHTGQDTLFTTTDSIDFTFPRLITVYASNGLSRRTYTVRLNVYNEPSGVFVWEKITAADARVQALSEQKSFLVDGQWTVFGKEGATTVRLTTDSAAIGAWTRTELTTLVNIDISSVCRFADAFYALGADRLYMSSDGETWMQVNTNISFDKLIGSGTAELYALSGNRAYHSADGATWTEDALDASADRLPQTDIASVVFRSRTNEKTEFVVLVGISNGEPQTWKYEKDLTGKESRFWSYYPATEENPYCFPYLQRPQLFGYNGYQLALGYTNEGLSPFYVSKDGGRTWIVDEKTYILPSELKTPVTSFAVMVDGVNYLWLFCGGTGEVWRAKLNRY